jgi:predicted site-specific integrase-resolvase
MSRREVAQRWGVSVETIKRRTREGLLHPVRFNQRLIRYPLSEIIRIEKEASGQAPIFSKLRLSPNVGFRQFLASQIESRK